MKSVGNSLLYIAVTAIIVVSSCSMEDTGALEKEPEAASSGCVMEFVRKGGYLGVHNEFRIYPDGKVFNSVGETARVSSELVADWVEMIEPAAVPVSKETRFSGMMGWDCYFYGITIHDKGEPKLLSLACTDTYSLDKDGEISVIDIGPIRDTLLGLSWERVKDPNHKIPAPKQHM